ncbi:hypothetical protein BGX29_009775 [Mortierella sp. GBA35]|nr:hypothetical protein BGX29_009775 [Mortierella sp. GBA35]
MTDSDSDIPTIDAIFVVRFDTRQGNVLEWSDSTSGCVGVAVYKNTPADRDEHRGARMIAVGVLVKPSAETGRCGQVWRHIDFLKSRAGHHVLEGSDTTDLVDYFATHKTPTPAPRPSSSSSSKRDSYRAMNRRRVSRSFTLSEPVHALQSAAGGMSDSTDADEIPTRSSERLQPLFCVGIHDIDHMTSLRGGFVACTTDKLFLYKPHLFDVLVDLSAASGSAVAYTSPKETRPSLSIVKEIKGQLALEATEPHLVDHRRYFALMQQLARYQRRQDWMQKRLIEEISETEAGREGGDTRTLEDHDNHRERHGRQASGLSGGGFNMSDTLGMMLTGGWWWWYGSDEEEEDYEPLIPNKSVPGQVQGLSQDGEDQRRGGARLQVLQMHTSGSSSTEAIRCFHNLTRTVLSELNRLIAFKTTAAIFEDADTFSDNAEEEESRRRRLLREEGATTDAAAAAPPPLQLSRHDIQQLGLDPSREGPFVEELSQIYFNADVRVHQDGIGAWLQSLACCSNHTCCHLCS